MSAGAATRFAPRLHDPDEISHGPRLKQLCAMYCRSKPQLSEGAAQQYQAAVNLCRRWLLAQRHGTWCEEIFTLERFLDWSKWLSQGRAPDTINGRLDTLWMLWNFAEEEGFSGPRPPARKKPRWRTQKKDPVAWAMEQIVQLLAAATKARPMRLCPWWTADFWVTLIACYLATAERFQALLRCPRSALSGNVLTVPAQLTKDGKESPVVLPDWIAEKMRRLPVIGASDLFWPYPFRFKQLRERYTEDILKPAGLPTTRRHKFHALRRSSLTQVLISFGTEAAREQARHFSAGLTLERYISRAVVKQQTGSPGFNVPPPTSQLKLF